MSVPSSDFSTMDGFAFAAADDYPLSISGDVGPADDPPAIDPGETVRIATGAPLPDRADAVLPNEDATVVDDDLTGPQIEAGTNRHPAGATAKEGERLFDTGETLAPRHAALLRDVGIADVTVAQRLSVGIIATGTEIHEGRQPDRDSEFVANLVRRWGHTPNLLGSVPDEESAVADAIASAAADHDVVLSSGGTGFGRGDYVRQTLTDHDLLFAGVALRPGSLVVAALVDGTPVCGLPGKPMAAHTAATLVLRPLFTGQAQQAAVRAELDVDVAMPAADCEYAVPVRLENGSASPVGHAETDQPLYGTRFNPGRVASSPRVSHADGLVLTTDSLASGTDVSVVPYEVIE
jgi:molybdopterin molybdotransferase